RVLRNLEHPLAQVADVFIFLVYVTMDEAENLLAQQCFHVA
ncbi:ADP-ribose pyrophosphatase, partial [Listeria monocytogenes]